MPAPADPEFAKLAHDSSEPSDLRLSKRSPAIDAGEIIPARWPDALREADKGKPDVGAVPFGAESWGVGVDGRIPVFGSAKEPAR